MKRNIELLTETMQHILDHPEQHDQDAFVCGTAACFCGRAALLSGWSADMINDTEMMSAGAKLLGLKLWEAGRMFRSDNTIEMLELMVKDIVNDEELGTILHYMRLTGDLWGEHLG